MKHTIIPSLIINYSIQKMKAFKFIGMLSAALALSFTATSCGSDEQEPSNNNGNSNSHSNNNGGGSNTSKLEAVDLGLPSGTKWANMNLGASTIYEVGDYYAWGELEPYYTGSASNPTWKSGKSAGYAWESYRFTGSWNEKEEEYNVTKYNTEDYCGAIDGKTVLEPEDDAATKKLGSKWSMPTKAQFYELGDYTIQKDTVIGKTHYMKIKAVKSPNYILLPYSGNFDGTELVRLENNVAEFWLSEGDGWGANYGEWSDSGYPSRNGTDRVRGIPVRAVCK